jgi:hypothetical protein
LKASVIGIVYIFSFIKVLLISNLLYYSRKSG